MKLPIDFILRLMKKMCDDFELENISKAIKKHIELSDDIFVRYLPI